MGLLGSLKKLGSMEQSWNSKGDILTSLEAQINLKPKAISVGIIPGNVSSFTRYPAMFVLGVAINYHLTVKIEVKGR